MRLPLPLFQVQRDLCPNVYHQQKANAFAPNWGQTIFQSASEIAQNTNIRTTLADILATAGPEREAWEKRRETIRESFFDELDRLGDDGQGANAAPAVKAPQSVGSSAGAEDAVLVQGGGPADAGAKKGAKARKK